MKKLNLGAGEVAIAGYEPRDATLGHTIYPLPDEDGSVDEIRASHVLEHFGHGEVLHVLRDWVRALKPGGVLKIAVPDFQHIAEQYLAGADIPIQGYVMGAQNDALNFHKTVFDAEMLGEALRGVGLIGIRRWVSEAQDCAALPVSLNLAGTKPGGPRPKVAAVMSVPRLAFSDNLGCIAELAKTGIPVRKVTGAFWGPCLTRAIEEAIAEHAPEWILTVDYDTVWRRAQLETLLDLAVRHPAADAIAPLQCKRNASTPLFFIRGEDGKAVTEIDRRVLDQELVPVTSAHFGLTLLRVAALEQLKRPWFCGQPDASGRWGEGRVDDDIWFWRRWEEAGRKCCIAPRVPVGHAELMLMWPDVNLEPTFQHPSAFWKSGPPDNVWR